MENNIAVVVISISLLALFVSILYLISENNSRIKVLENKYDTYQITTF